MREHGAVEAVEPLALKGKREPLRAFRLLGSRAGRGPRPEPRSGRARAGARRPARGVRAQRSRRGAASWSTLLGAPGIGKSRLVRELAAGAGRPGARPERALPVLRRGRARTGRWPRWCARRPGSGSRSRPRSRGRSSPHCSPARRRASPALVASLIGLDDQPQRPEESLWARPPARSRAGARWPLDRRARRSAVGRAGPPRPRRGGSPGLDAPAAAAVRRPSRAAPSGAPGLLARKRSRLAPLGEADSRRLADGVAGAVDARGRRARRAATGGNPLFVRELVRALVDDGRLERRDGALVATVPLDELPLPPTLEALLAARLERLRARERAVAESASVVGEEFRRDEVARAGAATAARPDARLVPGRAGPPGGDRGGRRRGVPLRAPADPRRHVPGHAQGARAPSCTSASPTGSRGGPATGCGEVEEIVGLPPRAGLPLSRGAGARRRAGARARAPRLPAPDCGRPARARAGRPARRAQAVARGARTCCPRTSRHARGAPWSSPTRGGVGRPTARRSSRAGPPRTRPPGGPRPGSARPARGGGPLVWTDPPRRGRWGDVADGARSRRFEAVGDHRGLARAYRQIGMHHFGGERFAPAGDALTQALDHARRPATHRAVQELRPWQLTAALVWGHCRSPRASGARRSTSTRCADAPSNELHARFVLCLLLFMAQRHDDARAVARAGRGRHTGPRPRARGVGCSTTSAGTASGWPGISRPPRRTFAAPSSGRTRGVAGRPPSKLAEVYMELGRYEEAGRLADRAAAATVEQDLQVEAAWRAVKARVLARRGRRRGGRAPGTRGRADHGRHGRDQRAGRRVECAGRGARRGRPPGRRRRGLRHGARRSTTARRTWPAPPSRGRCASLSLRRRRRRRDDRHRSGGCPGGAAPLSAP